MILFFELQFIIAVFVIFLIFLDAVSLEIVKILPPILPVMLLVALFTLLERKLLSSVQRRRGPNVVGVWGLLQPFADAFKLIFKETIIPGLSNMILFLIAPILTFTISLLNWALLPLTFGVVLSDLQLGVMFLFAFSSLGVYGIVLSGWSSNSKYAFLGSLRSAAQFLSYEVSIAITVMPVLLSVESLNFTNIVEFQNEQWFVIIFWPAALMFFIATLAETNRVPFDLPEAESELVSGYNVEYAATTFVLFFLAEYSNIIIMSFLITIFFFGGWWFFFFDLFLPFWMLIFFKVFLFLNLFILVRATIPRYRYDQLMTIGWTVLLPLSLFYFMFISVIIWIIV